jgi:hypothetical protein
LCKEYHCIACDRPDRLEARSTGGVDIEPIPGLAPWTDSFSNLFGVTK